jgi:peptidoglycan/xylan/chitin deacetylase (PgdA/CDA1 family)
MKVQGASDKVQGNSITGISFFIARLLYLVFLYLVPSISMKYFIKTPWWLKKIYPNRLWNVETKEKVIYLTFDDGPHPVATPFVLDELKKFDAKATFFCIGKNVVDQPAIYKRILEEGHSVGNHTQNHLNGWKTVTLDYLADVKEAASHIKSDLFRPPYGKIKRIQANGISKAMNTTSAKIVMWDILSGDFDNSLSKEKCLKNVINKTKPGSIIVFHDSQKAFPKLQFTLPPFLEAFTGKGFTFRSL